MSSRLDSSVLPSQPMTVAQIVARAQDYDFNSAIQLRYWLRSASSMLYEVCTHPIDACVQSLMNSTGERV